MMPLPRLQEVVSIIKKGAKRFLYTRAFFCDMPDAKGITRRAKLVKGGGIPQRINRRDVRVMVSY
jgi:hypothetical protein